ncbi:phosphotransferase [Pseudokineococcus sp. 1T1Z-3]|uniref:phosphotransferase n=1 Tax=Pseudokineococcus sp. 1T1Z-3 TaxID=3132745 RepID=UPI0030A49F2E
MHEGQLTVDATQVAALVREQLPAWGDLPVRALPQLGTVNASFRLGDDLVVRLPLVAGDVGAARAQRDAEAAAARLLVGQVGVETPEPVATGEPGPGVPVPWSVWTWVPGEVATPTSHASSSLLADDLAAAVAALRTIPTGGRTFAGGGRGGSLPDHDAWVATCLRRSDGLVDVAPLRRLWARLRELPPSPGGDVTTHGDLVPGNIVVAGGRLAGLVDVGGAGPADPALDLVGAWHLLDAPARAAFRDALGTPDLEWARGAAWALEQALGLGWYYRDSNPVMSQTGLRTLGRLADGAAELMSPTRPRVRRLRG